MEYKDVIKFLSLNKPDIQSLVHLANIEAEHGKEAVIASLTYSIPRQVNVEPNEIGRAHV